MDLAVLEQTSEQFLGQWKRLVSTTNWEKGQIIFHWRSALVAAGAGVSEYADEVWSRQVGQITPQHVGRLRRVFERFGEVREDYPGLYWSHFQAALDWDDAEMWLEGAVQSSWSIADMRAKRAETLGTSNDPLAAADQEGQWDEDAEPGDERCGPSVPRSTWSDRTTGQTSTRPPTRRTVTMPTTSMPARARQEWNEAAARRIAVQQWRARRAVASVRSIGVAAGRRRRSVRGDEAVHHQASPGRLGRDCPGRPAGRARCAALAGPGRGRCIRQRVRSLGIPAQPAPMAVERRQQALAVRPALLVAVPDELLEFGGHPMNLSVGRGSQELPVDLILLVPAKLVERGAVKHAAGQVRRHGGQHAEQRLAEIAGDEPRRRLRASSMAARSLASRRG